MVERKTWRGVNGGHPNRCVRCIVFRFKAFSLFVAILVSAKWMVVWCLGLSCGWMICDFEYVICGFVFEFGLVFTLYDFYFWNPWFWFWVGFDFWWSGSLLAFGFICNWKPLGCCTAIKKHWFWLLCFLIFAFFCFWVLILICKFRLVFASTIKNPPGRGGSLASYFWSRNGGWMVFSLDTRFWKSKELGNTFAHCESPIR